MLRPVYVEDPQFRQSFADLALAGSQRKLVRYVLGRLESDASRRECGPRVDPGTIEHVLPARQTQLAKRAVRLWRVDM